MRLNINTTGHQIDAEKIVVPSSSPYVVRLKHHWVKEETPSSIEVWTDSEKLESQLTEEAYDGNPSSGDKFQVDYKGEQDTEPVYKNALLFHSFQAGQTLYVWYKSQGDVYCAEDINAKADKDSDAVENNLAKFDSSGNPVDSGIASNTVPIATTQNLTFYVNPSTGNDNNNGSSGSPFKTIAKAISLIPQIVNHTVTINLADGSYSEGITLSGYVGSGSIEIMGNTTTPTDVVISGQVFLTLCATRLFVSGLKTTYVGGNAFVVSHCLNRTCLDYLVATDSVGANVYSGLYVFASSHVRVENSTFSNKYYGISSSNTSSVLSAKNSGTGNNIGLRAFASIIFKDGAQPGGTTAEATAGGGEIR